MAKINAADSKDAKPTSSKKLDEIIESKKNVLENIDELIAEGNVDKDLEVDDNMNKIGKLLNDNQIICKSHCLHEVWICQY